MVATLQLFSLFHILGCPSRGSNSGLPFCPIRPSCQTLLPLKLTLFFYSAAAFAILPYLTIHMKDIGISDIDVALIYTILPFCVFLAPPVVGFFADKLGNYTR